MAIFAGVSPNLKGIKYFDLLFCHNHSINRTQICSTFEQNQGFELYHLLPGSAWFSQSWRLIREFKRDIDIVNNGSMVHSFHTTYTMHINENTLTTHSSYVQT